MRMKNDDEGDREREEREAEELESFEKRAEWMRTHYGVPPEEADERVRQAAEQAERMPDGRESDEGTRT